MGNLGKNVHHWPVKKYMNTQRIIIPYSTVKPTQEELEMSRVFQLQQAGGKLNKAEQKMLKQMLQQMSKSEVDDVHLTVKLYHEIQDIITNSIAAWNATGLVQLLTLEEYKKEYEEVPQKSLKFETSNKEGVCYAPCIGMCPANGVQIISCDIEAEFHSSALQSMMHELGHVIGLRHEFAREDRDEFVKTNFAEKFKGDSTPVGSYDFHSIMHYEVGRFSGSKYLLINDAWEASILTNFPQQAKQLLDALKNSTGSTAKLSPGDLEAVKQIIQITQEEVAATAAAAAAAAAASAASANQLSRMSLEDQPTRSSSAGRDHYVGSPLGSTYTSNSHSLQIHRILDKRNTAQGLKYLVEWNNPHISYDISYELASVLNGNASGRRAIHAFENSEEDDSF